MKKFFFTLLCVLSLLETRAQWTSLGGPEGDAVNGLLEIDGTLLAATANGLFRSDDLGETWMQSGDSIAGKQVFGITRLGDLLFAYCNYSPNQELYRSADKGLNWTLVPSSNLPKGAFHQFVASENALFLTFPSIYRSLDEGLTWQPVSGIPNYLTYYYTRLVVEGKNFFVSAPDNGIFFSTDEGDSWKSLTDNLPKKPYRGFAHGNRLFAAFYEGAWKIYASDNLGQSWNPDNTQGLQLTPDHFAYHAGFYYAMSGGKIWRRPESGNTWTVVADNTAAPFTGQTNVSIQNRVKFYSFGGRLFATSTLGIFLSEDLGQSWREVYKGLLNGDVRTILSREGTVLASARANGFRYRDSLWTMLPPALNLTLAYSEIDGKMYAGANFSLHRSEDKGLTWQKLPLPYVDFYTRVVKTGTDYVVGCTQGAYRSSDQGQTWTFTAQDLIYLEIDVFLYPRMDELIALGDTVIAGNYSQQYRSVNRGVNWTKTANIGVKQFFRSGNRLFCVTPNGTLYFSDNSGESWTLSNTGITTGITSITQIDETLYAGTRGGVYESVDNGLSWTFDGVGFPSGLLLITSLDTAGGKLYAGTEGAGVWVRSFYVSGEKESSAPALAWVVPNPFADRARVVLPEGLKGEGILHVFDASGRLLRSENILLDNIFINRENLPAEVLYICIEQSGKIAATGKVVALK